MIVNMHDAKSSLSRLIRKVEDGEEVLIGRNGKPVARLVPYVARPGRRPGRLAGKITVEPDFDQTPPEVIRAFQGSASNDSAFDDPAADDQG
ncbi:type II toxin-antitoxin system Phd/YefM family antitoxin [Euzebya tangerina]|uniref:type II toxin-antitoxin system Phd/YefM family antitoxin n=1 Tax=Euzebya tangerina TaxID=591198 RepID=UPI000E3180D0|nr:type II toxin-antitoxin system prevent-host-death family antitoxin [Euzebya tangerina]